MPFPEVTDINLKENMEAAVKDVFEKYATPFGSQRTAEQHIQFAIDPSKGLTRRRYGWYSNGSFFDGTNVAEDDDTGTIRLTTTATGTDTLRIRSSVPGQYVSQSLAQPGVGLELDAANLSFNSNDEVSLSHGVVAVGAGWHDGGTDGWSVGEPDVDEFIGIKYDDTGAYAVLISNGVHRGDSPVHQSDWNIDSMNNAESDRKNPSDLRLEPGRGYIYNFPYTWYAYGALFVGAIHPNKNELVLFHKFDVDGASLSKPNIAPMVVMDNASTATALGANLGGMQYSLYGADVNIGAGEERALETSRRSGASYVSTQVATANNAIDPNGAVGEPLIGIRRQSGVRDLRLRVTELIPEPDNDIYLFAWDEYDTATALNGTWREPNEPINSTETLAEVNTDCTTYTPTVAVMRGWDKATTAKTNEETLSSLTTDDEIPVDAARVYTAVHDGSSAEVELRARVVEGY